MMTQNVRRIGVADASCEASCWSYRIFSYGVEGNVQCPRNSYSKVEDDLSVAIQLARVFEFDVRNDSNGTSERSRARRSTTAFLCMPWLRTFYSISLSCHTSNVFFQNCLWILRFNIPNTHRLNLGWVADIYTTLMEHGCTITSQDAGTVICGPIKAMCVTPERQAGTGRRRELLINLHIFILLSRSKQKCPQIY